MRHVGGKNPPSQRTASIPHPGRLIWVSVLGDEASPASTPSHLLHNATECGSKAISIFLIDGQKQGANRGTGLSWWLSGKESACQCWRLGLDLCVGTIPWGRKWQPTPVFLPGKLHRQRSLAGYSPRGHKESDMMSDCPFHSPNVVRSPRVYHSGHRFNPWSGN